MTAEEIKELKKGILLTAKYYGRDLSGDVITMMASDLDDLDFSAVLNAYTHYRRDPKNKTMPLPAQIREIVCPVASPIASARAIVGKICEAITRFGYSNPQEARAFIGESGWDAIRRSGGWSLLCESDFTFNHGRQAQMRDSIADHIQHGPALLLNEPARPIPLSENEEILKLENEKTKQLDDLMEKFNLNSDFTEVEK